MHAIHTPIAPDLQPAISEALKRIPPLWPLEHFVAVNPFLGFADRSFTDTCATLRRTVGKSPNQTPKAYLEAWGKGTITPADLASVADDEWTQARLIETMEKNKDAPFVYPVSTFADILDRTLPHAHWAAFISEEISKHCAVHYDRNQTIWVSPWRHLGLFAAWKMAAAMDRNAESFGIPGFREFVSNLPVYPESTIRRCLVRLDPQGVELSDFLHCQLAGISGWAGHVQYRVREATLRGNQDPALLELLAIRLTYDAALHDAFGDKPQVREMWEKQSISSDTTDLDHALGRWQKAYEAGFQKDLVAKLLSQSKATASVRPGVQAVFCIDVRSEIVRRHLESALPGTETLGFAGFFGFPVAHQGAYASRAAAHCPALLVPPVFSRETPPADAARHRAEKGAWKAFQNSAASCFTFVESLGLAFGAKLINLRSSGQPCASPFPEIMNLSPSERAALAEGALRGMSLTKNFARLVLLCGHGSHSANNPYASSLDCGACGGHAGDVNARLAATAFNDPEVRALLAESGIAIPDDTLFLAGRHDTLEDEFWIFEMETVPASHLKEVSALQSALTEAGVATRKERAVKLGIGKKGDAAIKKAVRARGVDIAQIRPEWALANNAALVAAPRSRTAGLNLEGRVFLHEYDPSSDPELKTLTSILTAPVVVASWINLQYYGSRIDPENLAAGDKTIHHVVAGLGVIEGNAGDLCGGLPLQSIHDGTKFVHEPRRLTVIIESETHKVDSVLDAQPEVKQLFDNEWIHLIAISGGSAMQRRAGHWQVLVC